IQTIVGTNRYRLEREDPLETLEVDITAVRESQIRRLAELRAGRNEAECQKALEAITECVKSGKGNLLELAVEAAQGIIPVKPVFNLYKARGMILDSPDAGGPEIVVVG
ncbi:MAG: hypothetical protein HGA84_03640, partial [Syntrophobacteraceae bacterium]|nr:hypothetical protein [Syntrophobacteraceae bacterium]